MEEFQQYSTKCSRLLETFRVLNSIDKTKSQAVFDLKWRKKHFSLRDNLVRFGMETVKKNLHFK